MPEQEINELQFLPRVYWVQLYFNRIVDECLTFFDMRNVIEPKVQLSILLVHIHFIGKDYSNKNLVDEHYTVYITRGYI